MPKPSSSSRPRRMWGLAALVAGLALTLSACTSSGSPGGNTVTVTRNGTPSVSTPGGSSSGSSPAASSTAPKGKPVHVRLTNADGSEVGVGMPVIAYFSKKITEAKTLSSLTTVTVNGAPQKAAWYFEYSSAFKGFPIEGHLRLQHYWPAHAQIHVGLPLKGKSAGPGLTYDDSLTLDFSTGASHILVVDDSTHRLTVTSDGKPAGTYPVSLGATKTPTLRGTKVIMEKGASICMSGPGYHECGVRYTQRLTYGGEYLHAAPWNTRNIGHFDSSNGCTNLLTPDAKTLYGALEIGDVVTYPNADGPKMGFGDGYGDWNVAWSLWQTGGLVSTR